jgi:CRP-like cAMP-binding protein
METLINILKTKQRTPDDLQVIASFLLAVDSLTSILEGLSTGERNHLCRACSITAYERGQKVFSKGDKSDKFFVIIQGRVECINVIEDTVCYITVLTAMQTLGEKGLMTGHSRALTATALTPTYLLCIAAKDFKTYLERGVLYRFEIRLSLVESSVPAIATYTTAQKMNIVYAFIEFTFKRNQLILPPLALSEFLYFVVQGECVLTVFRRGQERRFVKLSRRACFGDESVLLGRRSEYGVRVTSESAEFLALKRSDVQVVFLEETLAQLRHNCDMKQASRSLLTKFSSRRPSVIKASSTVQRFPLASPQARKLLMEAVNRSFTQLETSSRSSLSPTSHIKRQLVDLRLNEPHRSRSLNRRRPPLLGVN